VRLAFAFFQRFLPNGTNVYIPNPTWPNHLNIARDSNLSFKEYRYFDPKTKGVDITGLLEDLNNAE
jgi:aspartate/tyrosine/aromatic aminotransferase